MGARKSQVGKSYLQRYGFRAGSIAEGLFLMSSETPEALSPPPCPPFILCKATFLLWPRAGGGSRSFTFTLSLLESVPVHSPHPPALPHIAVPSPKESLGLPSRPRPRVDVPAGRQVQPPLQLYPTPLPRLPFQRSCWTWLVPPVQLCPPLFQVLTHLCFPGVALPGQESLCGLDGWLVSLPASLPRLGSCPL